MLDSYLKWVYIYHDEERDTMKIPVYECQKCGNKWVPRTDKKPKACPQCNCRKWDGKRK